MIPKNLQGVLWSTSVKDLDLQKNKNYIIHQILAYGTWENLQWLFKTYPLEEIKSVFLNHPEKDYTFPAFNFVRNVLLNLNSTFVDQTFYVRSFPRNIRPK